MTTQDETLTLHSRHHDKIGVLHCGVTCEGFVAVAGDTSNIADGEEIEFERAHITVKRKGDDYTFIRHH